MIPVQIKKVALMSQTIEISSFKKGGFALSVKKNMVPPAKKMKI